MEFMAGGSLADRPGYRFSEQICKALAYQLLSALHYLHDLDILHRDIKPCNILLVTKIFFDFRVKLANFGLSKWVSEFSKAATVCGTKPYQAPEMLTAGRKRTRQKLTSGHWEPRCTNGKCQKCNIQLYQKFLVPVISWGISRVLDF